MTGHSDKSGIRSFASRVIVLCMVLGLMIDQTGTVGGQTPEPAASPATPGTPVATPAGGSATPMASPVMDDVTPGSFASYGYDDVTAQGMFASASYWFPLPLAASSPVGGSVELRFSHSPLLQPDLSTMTVLVNGQSIESVNLTEESAGGGEVSVSLPELEQEAESINLTLAFHLRLTRDTCEIPDDPALWVTIHKESSINVPIGTGAADLHLADAPGLMDRSFEETGVGPVLSLPGDAQPEVLDAAGIVSYQVGRWSGQRGESPSIGGVVQDVPEGDTAAILVGTGSSLEIDDGWGALTWDGERFLLDGEPVPAGHGVLAIRQQPVPQMLVSGADPAAVLLAANALMRPMDSPVFDAPVVILSGELPEANAGKYAWGEQAASFAQLGQGRQDVTGPGEHFIDLPFERPAGWVLDGGSSLHLDLSVSPAVRHETSWVRVTVNGLDIGTLPLRAEEGVHTYEFELPVERLNATLDGHARRDLNVQIRVFLDYPHEACESIDPQSTWAALMPTSAWLLPHQTYDGMDIGRFPAGFSLEDEQGNAVVVLPDQATREEMHAAMTVASAIGRWNAWAPPVAPQVTYAGQANEEAFDDRPVILIGGPERNSASGRLEDETSADMEPTAYTGSRIPFGILAMGESPWSGDHAALLVAGSGEDGHGTLLAAAALGDTDVLSMMEGARVVVTGDLVPHTISGADPPNALPSDLAPRIVPDERPWIERLEAWQVISGVTLVAFLALVIGVVQLRWIRGGRR